MYLRRAKIKFLWVTIIFDKDHENSIQKNTVKLKSSRIEPLIMKKNLNTWFLSLSSFQLPINTKLLYAITRSKNKFWKTQILSIISLICLILWEKWISKICNVVILKRFVFHSWLTPWHSLIIKVPFKLSKFSIYQQGQFK